jgi:hypothetical protein
MTQVGVAITESVVLHYGRREFLSRLSDPFWFQALGAVIGNGLALVGNYDVGAGCVEARLAAARA